MKLPILTVPEQNACGCIGQAAVQSHKCHCSTTGLVQILGRKHALRLFFLIAERKLMRFTELKSEMQDLSSSTLTIRLAELEGARLIHRQEYSETAPRVEYSLTKDGEDMHKNILALSKFASRR